MNLIRVAAAIGGLLIVLLGIVMIPLPGPGLRVLAAAASLFVAYAWDIPFLPV